MKHKILFDTTDAETIAASDSIGAFLRSADGTLLTHTTEGAKEALDVSIANTSIAVTATDLDIRDLDAAQDSVAAWLADGAGTAITSTGGAIDVNIKTSDITLDVDLQAGAEKAEDSAATSGDIGNFVLAVRQDTLASSTSADGDYSAFKVNEKGELYVKDADVLAQLISGVTVTATDLDIRDLSAAQDNVAISDGVDTLAINADGSINVVAPDSSLANTAILASAASVTTTSAAVLGSALASRKALTVYNNGNKMVFVGQSGVSVSNGFPLPPGSLLEMKIGAAVALHAVAENGTQNVRALELA